jgi:hypothetical protein
MKVGKALQTLIFSNDFDDSEEENEQKLKLNYKHSGSFDTNNEIENIKEESSEG